MGDRICVEAGCSRPSYARGLCVNCYTNHTRWGTLDKFPSSRPAPDTRVIEGEQWRPIPEHEGYEASSTGRIRSLDRDVVKRDGSVAWHRGRVLVQAIPDDGHNRPVVNIRGKTRRVSHLVAAAFHGPRPDGTLVRHWNDTPTDNRPENLLYGTKSDNSDDAVRNGVHQMTMRKRCPLDHPLDGDNLRPDVAKDGHRGCLACARAHSYVSHHPEADLKETADFYYQRIVAGDTSPISPHWRSGQTCCNRGHLLQEPNLRRSTARQGSRGCLACHRASGYLQNHPELDMQATSDRYYAKIMGAAA